jgi:hypothetical protein
MEAEAKLKALLGVLSGTNSPSVAAKEKKESKSQLSDNQHFEDLERVCKVLRNCLS